MEIYLVMSKPGGDSEEFVEKAFRTKESAEKWIENNTGYYFSYYINEINLED